MLLTTLTANLQSSYAQIQSQIEALQEQQRLIQAQLQRVGSVESKMESAAALVAEAIAEIRDVCPEELSAYQEVIGSLFCSQPIAQIQAGTDIATESEPQENSVPPSVDDTQEPAVEVAAQQVEEETTDTLLTLKEIEQIPWTALKKMASDRKINDPSGQRLTRKFAAVSLHGQLWRSNLAGVSGLPQQLQDLINATATPPSVA
jgi:hypothetical protein